MIIELLQVLGMSAGLGASIWVLTKYLVQPLAESASERLEGPTTEAAVARAKKWVPDGVVPEFVGLSAVGEPTARWHEGRWLVQVSEVRAAAGGYSSFVRLRVRVTNSRSRRSESELIPTGRDEWVRVAAAKERVLSALIEH